MLLSFSSQNWGCCHNLFFAIVFSFFYFLFFPLAITFHKLVVIQPFPFLKNYVCYFENHFLPALLLYTLLLSAPWYIFFRLLNCQGTFLDDISQMVSFFATNIWKLQCQQSTVLSCSAKMCFTVLHCSSLHPVTKLPPLLYVHPTTILCL